MPLSEDLGLTEQELENVSPELRDKLTDRYAKIVGHRILQTDQMLQDDHEYLKALQKTTADNLLGSDTHSCDDATGGLQTEDGMRITILGDVQGDSAVQTLRQMTDQNIEQKASVQQPKPEPKPSPLPAKPKPKPDALSLLGKVPWFQILTLAGLAYGGWQLSRPQYVDVPARSTTIDAELLTEIEGRLD